MFTTFDRPRLPFLGTMNLPDPEGLLRERDERGVGFQSYLHDEDYGIAVASADHVRAPLTSAGAFEVLHHDPLGVVPAAAHAGRVDVPAPDSPSAQ